MMNADGTNRWQVSEPIPQAGDVYDGVVAGWQKKSCIQRLLMT